ncbi:Hypothetical predicted protein [Cloeon dipterum]|uniref:BTB domain-containing protein n=1 Tax=Cloeon dipterum TaxID=197152 RepID=A0A8S1C7N0_9INSE|nr:Hypothetical predicted protein [Cloeon dipterum]
MKKCMTLKELAKHFFVENEESPSCTVTFIVGDGDGNLEEVEACMKVLAANSDYFNVLLNEGKTENRKIRLQLVEPDVFKLIVEFTHLSGWYKSTVDNLDLCLRLARAALEYSINDLITECTQLSKALLSDSKERDLWDYMSLNSDIQFFVQQCLELMATKAEFWLKLPSFCKASEDVVQIFLQRDDLNVSSEVELFRACRRYSRGKKRDVFKRVCQPHLRLMFITENMLTGGEEKALLTECKAHTNAYSNAPARHRYEDSTFTLTIKAKQPVFINGFDIFTESDETKSSATEMCTSMRAPNGKFTNYLDAYYTVKYADGSSGEEQSISLPEFMEPKEHSSMIYTTDNMIETIAEEAVPEKKESNSLATFLVGEDEGYLEEMIACKKVLAESSDYFKVLLDKKLNFSPISESGKIRLRLVEPDIFKLIVEFTHLGGRLESNVDSLKLCLRLARAADKYLIDDLFMACSDLSKLLLGAKKTRDLWAYLDWHLDIEFFVQQCLQVMARNAEFWLRHRSFRKVSKDAVTLFLQRDDLNVSAEVVLFQACRFYSRGKKSDVFRRVCLPHLRLSWVSDEFLNAEEKAFLAKCKAHPVAYSKALGRSGYMKSFSVIPEWELTALGTCSLRRNNTIVIKENSTFVMTVKAKRPVFLNGFDIFTESGDGECLCFNYRVCPHRKMCKMYKNYLEAYYTVKYADGSKGEEQSIGLPELLEPDECLRLNVAEYLPQGAEISVKLVTRRARQTYIFFFKREEMSIRNDLNTIDIKLDHEDRAFPRAWINYGIIRDNFSLFRGIYYYNAQHNSF